MDQYRQLPPPKKMEASFFFPWPPNGESTEHKTPGDLSLTLSILPLLPRPPCWAVGKPHGKEIVTRFPRCRRAAWPGRFSGRADNLEDIKAGRKGTLLLAGWAEGPGEGLVTGEKSKQGGSQSKQPLPAPARTDQGQHLQWAERML